MSDGIVFGTRDDSIGFDNVSFIPRAVCESAIARWNKHHPTFLLTYDMLAKCENFQISGDQVVTGPKGSRIVEYFDLVDVWFKDDE